MPQPLPTKKEFTLKLGKEALEKRICHAAKIAQVAAAWGHLEVQFEILVLLMLGTESRIGHAIYSALTGSGAQRSTIDAIAKATLIEDEQKILADIWVDFSARGKERNRIVHGVWAYSDTFPDHIILFDTKPWIEALARFESKPVKTQSDDDAIQEAMRKGKHLLYALKDFEDVERRMIATAAKVAILAIAIRHRRPLVSKADDPGSDG